MQALFPDAATTASYLDALAVVEFVNTFGRLWETTPISLSDLQQALDSPEDHPQLGELYHVLLSCVLLDQVCPAVDSISPFPHLCPCKIRDSLAVSLVDRILPMISSWACDQSSTC